MALARLHNWIANEVLNASDLNAELNNILNNASSLVSPFTATLDFDGNTLILDAAGATQVVSSAAISWNFTSGAKSGTPATTGSVANWSAQTFTDSATAGSGTATAWTGFAIQRPTLAATNATVATTDAATFYVSNAPAAGSNETLTNAWALWTDDGAIRHDLTNSKASAAGATLRSFYMPAATQTVTGSTSITTVAGFNLIEIEQPTISAASALTITHAATMYIANAPVGGGAGPATITNAWALWIDAGGVRLDGEIRMTAGAVNFSRTTVASSATPDIWTGTGNIIDYTGTVTSTGLAAAPQAGAQRLLIAAGASLLTNGANYIVQGNANYTTAAGDKILVDAITTTQFRLTIFKVDGTPIVPPVAATQAEQETSTSLLVPVTPGRQQYHPSAAKGWVKADFSGGAAASYNVTSITDNGAGDLTVVWNVDFSSVHYSVVATILSDAAGSAATTFVAQINNTTFAGASSRILCLRMSDFSAQDGVYMGVAAFGDQA